MGELVCVTGATGFLGSHVVRDLLAHGYRVRAAVRAPGDADRNRHLTSLEGGSGLSFVAADLEDPETFGPAFAGCDHVIHTASVLALTAKDPQREIVDVAVAGATNAARAAIAAKTVRRLVVTSSVAAVVEPTQPTRYRFTEADWCESSTVKSDAYATSKVKAERAARRLTSEAKDGPAMVSILPSLVLGPVLAEQHLKTSPVMLYELLRGAVPGVPDLHFGVVDVRDVARAHVRSLEVERPSERYVLSSEAMGMRAMAAILRTEVPGAKIPRFDLPNVLMYATALFDPRITFGFLKQNLGRAPLFDATRVKTELGVDLRPARESVADTARSIRDGGYLKKRR